MSQDHLYDFANALLSHADPLVLEARARAAKKRQADRDFEESIRLDNALPALTEADIVRSVQSGKGIWRPLGTAQREKAEAEARDIEARREIGELIPIPEVELP